MIHHPLLASVINATLPDGNGGGGGIPSTNLILDLDARYDVYSDYSGTTAAASDGGSVGHWGDQSSYTYSGNPMSARQIDTSEKPRYFGSDSNRNNRPYLLFDSDDRYLKMEPYSGAYNINGGSSGLGGSTGKTGIHVYIVMTPTAQNYDGYLISKTSDFYHDDGWAFWMNSSENLEAYVVDDNFSQYNDVSNTDTVQDTACVVSYCFNTSDTESQRVNAIRVKNAGSSLGSRQTGATVDADSSFTLPSVNMLVGGGRNTTGSETTLYTFNGRIYRILMYHECHDVTTEANIMNQLGTDYNI